ncbi:MAG: ABC transporter ATP-binding protein [Geminicoccaceae bacterium]
MSPPYLQIQGLRMEFGEVVAVHDVTLDIRQGEFLTFLGPSGSGKSTTLYILAGFQQPTRGDILLNGRTLLDRPSHQRNIGMVFQRYTLFPNMTVGENVAFPLKVRRRSKAEIDAKVREMLRLVRLEGFEDRKVAKMSGGQQQRVALARALAYDPPVLLMDEPLSALDKKLREEIQHEIRRIHQQTEVTILYVTHDQEEAPRLSDRIAVFSHGRIDQVGTGAGSTPTLPPASWPSSSATATSWPRRWSRPPGPCRPARRRRAGARRAGPWRRPARCRHPAAGPSGSISRAAWARACP